MSVLQDLILKLIKEILMAQGKQFKGGYIETETEGSASVDNVKFQPEPTVNITGGQSLAKKLEPKDVSGSGVKPKKTNVWLDHVAKVKSENTGMKYKDVLKLAKDTYTKKESVKGGIIKNDSYYKTRVIDPVAEQKVQQAELKQEAKKPRGRPRKTQVAVDIPTASFTKSTTVKEKGTKLVAKKPLKFEVLDEPTKLSFDKPKERKYEKTALDSALGYDTALLSNRKPVPRKATSGEEDVPGLTGSGLETQMLKKVIEELKAFPENKKKTIARKIIKEELDKRGLKPIIQKQIISYVLKEIEKLSGGMAFGTSYALMTSLKESGIFDATKATFKSLTDRLDVILKDPGEHRKKLILTRDIPNLQFRLDKLKNLWDIKSKHWTEFRKENHQLAMLDVKSHIVALLNRVAGINMVQVKK